MIEHGSVGREFLLSPELRKVSPVTVLYGGNSSERPGSIESSITVANLLSEAGYMSVRRMDVTPDTVTQLTDRSAVGVAFLTMHGGFGENGTLQGFLEMLDIPYTGCGVAASSISADKTLFNKFVRASGYNAANQTSASSVDELSRLDLSYPLVLKPAAQGCSYGVFYVRDMDDLLARAEFTQQFGPMVVEDYIAGRELTVGLYEDVEGGRPVALPIIENILVREILDYETKYPGGEHLYEAVVPARLEPATNQQIIEICTDIFQRLNCRGYVRMDLRLAPDGNIYIIENNTSPGMLSLEESDFPKMLIAAGINPADFVDKMVLASLVNYKRDKENAAAVPSERETVEYLGLNS